MKTASLLLASLANITSAIESRANLCVEGPLQMRFQVTAECCQYMLPENHRAKRRLPDIVIVVDHAVAFEHWTQAETRHLGQAGLDRLAHTSA